MRRRLAPWGAWMLLIVALMAPTVRAQGTDRVLPDPITSRDLDQYAALLEMSDLQRLTVDRAHTEYLASFDALRTTEIETFLTESRQLFGRFNGQIDVEGIQDASRDYDRILKRIASLDNAFFDQVGALLDEQQFTMYDRTRLVRERQRLRSGLLFFMSRGSPALGIDISEVVAELDLDPDTAATLRAALDGYERTLTAEMRALSSLSMETFVELTERVAPLVPEGEPDPREFPRLMMQMQRILGELTPPVIDAVEDVVEHNWRGFTSAEQLLPTSPAMKLMSSFLSEAYGEVYQGIAPTVKAIDVARTRAMTDDAKRTALRALADDARRRHLAVARDMANAIDEARANMIRMRMGAMFGGGPNLQADKPRQEAIEKDVLLQLCAMYDVDSLEALMELPGAEDDPETVARKEAERERLAAAKRSDSTDRYRLSRNGIDTGVPAAIRAEEMAWYAEMLELAADERPLYDALYDDYRAAWDPDAETRRSALRDLRRSMWGWDREAGRPRVPAPETIDALYAARADARRALDARDAEFFDNIELALLDDSDEARARLDRVRRARQRVTVGRPPNPIDRWGRGGRQIAGLAGLDLSVIAWFALTDTDRTAIDAALVAYEEELTDAMVRRYDDSLRLAVAAEQRAAATAGDRRGGWDREPSAEDRAAHEAVLDHDQQIAALNESALRSFTSRLDGSAARTLEATMRAVAYPRVYGTDDLERLAERIRTLPDLAPSQQQQLDDVMLRYRTDRHALDQQLEAIERDRARPGLGSSDDRMESAERRSEFQRIEFARNELREKAERQVVAMLSEGQRLQLGIR